MTLPKIHHRGFVAVHRGVQSRIVGQKTTPPKLFIEAREEQRRTRPDRRAAQNGSPLLPDQVVSSKQVAIGGKGGCWIAGHSAARHVNLAGSVRLMAAQVDAEDHLHSPSMGLEPAKLGPFTMPQGGQPQQ